MLTAGPLSSRASEASSSAAVSPVNGSVHAFGSLEVRAGSGWADVSRISSRRFDDEPALSTD